MTALGAIFFGKELAAATRLYLALVMTMVAVFVAGGVGAPRFPGAARFQPGHAGIEMIGHRALPESPMNSAAFCVLRPCGKGVAKRDFCKSSPPVPNKRGPEGA